MLTLSFGRGAQRIWCPHRGATVPSASVTVTVYDDGGTVLLTSTAASKGSLSTTLSVAVVQGDRSFTVATTGGISVGDYFALVGDDQQAETFVARGVDTTAKTITADRPADRAYATNDLVKSASIYYSMALTATDTWAKGLYYQAIFDCTSWDTVRPVTFRIADAETENPITAEDVYRVLPSAGVYRGADTGAEMDNHREMAWRIISARILALGHDPVTVRDPERFAEAGGILAAALMMAGRPGGAEIVRTLAGDPLGSGGLFAEHWDRIVSIPHWWDRDQDKSRDSGETGNLRTMLRRGR